MDKTETEYNTDCKRMKLMEIWDAYDEKMNRIDDVILVRGKPIPNGQYHLVSEIIVRHTDGTYMVMQRDAKRSLGGKWEASAGGSALKGEDPLDCAMRELQEETGIITDRLTEIGRVIDHGHQTIYVEFLCDTSVDKSGIVLQEGETSAYKWLAGNELCQTPKNEWARQRIFNFIDEFR